MLLPSLTLAQVILGGIALVQNVHAYEPINVCPISLVCVYDSCLSTFTSNMTAVLPFCNSYNNPVPNEPIVMPQFAISVPSWQVTSACQCLIAEASATAPPTIGAGVFSTMPGNVVYTTITGCQMPTQVPGQSQTATFEAIVTPATECPSSITNPIIELVPLNGTNALIGYSGKDPDIYLQFPHEDIFVVKVTNTSLTIKNATSGDIGINTLGEIFYTPPDCFATFVFTLSSTTNSKRSITYASRKTKLPRQADLAPSLIQVQFELVNEDGSPNICTNPVLLCNDEGQVLSADFSTLSPGNYLGSCPFSSLNDLNTCINNVSPLLVAIKDILMIFDTLKVSTVLIEEGAATFCGAAFEAAGVALGFSAAFLDEALTAVIINPSFTFVGGAALIALYGACVYEYDKLTSLQTLLEQNLGFNVDEILDSQSTAEDLCIAASKFPEYEIDVVDAVNDEAIFQTRLLGFSVTSISPDPIDVPITCSSTDTSMPSIMPISEAPSMTPTISEEPTNTAAPSVSPTSSLICGIQEAALCDPVDVGGPACCASGLVCITFCVPQCDSPGVNCDHIPDICMTQCGAQNAPGTVFPPKL